MFEVSEISLIQSCLQDVNWNMGFKNQTKRYTLFVSLQFYTSIKQHIFYDNFLSSEEIDGISTFELINISNNAKNFAEDL